MVTRIGRTGAAVGKLRIPVTYSLIVAGTVSAFFLIRWWGSGLVAPPPSGGLSFGTREGQHQIDTLLHVLLALAVVIVMARLLGALCKYLHQPPVIGEILAGIILGPSLLGRLAPELSSYLLPSSVAPYFGVLSQIGIILFMFLVGLELDTHTLTEGTRATVVVSQAGIVVPFLLGSALSLWVYPWLSTSDVPFTVFALFMGVSMSVTAFPVLARILTDRVMHKTRLGVVALTCAAVDDVTAWCLLALVVSVVQARIGGAVQTILLALGYIAFVIFIARPIIVRWARRVDRDGEMTQPVMAVVIVGVLLSALTTEYIGIHAIFGAFLLGAVIPHKSVIAQALTRRLEDLVVVLLLPAFFAFTGMRTQIGLVNGVDQWLLCGVIILVACLGKFGGSAVAARVIGLPWREAAALGILMNTRGLMELIVLNIGLDLKVLSPTLFAMLVLMALVTTVMTTPILHLLARSGRTVEQPAGAVSLPS